MLATDDGDDIPSVNADERMVHHRTRCLFRIPLHNYLDRSILNDKFTCLKVQTRMSVKTLTNFLIFHKKLLNHFLI